MTQLWSSRAVNEAATPGDSDRWVSRTHLRCVPAADAPRYLEGGGGVRVVPYEQDWPPVAELPNEVWRSLRASGSGQTPLPAR